MTEIDRRRFLGATAGAAALGASSGHYVPPVSFQQLARRSSRPATRSPIITLGKTKIKMSRLGQGTGVHGGNRQSDQTRMGFAKLVDLMHHAYDRGIRFFDLADLYGACSWPTPEQMSAPAESVLTTLHPNPATDRQLPAGARSARVACRPSWHAQGPRDRACFAHVWWTLMTIVCGGCFERRSRLARVAMALFMAATAWRNG